MERNRAKDISTVELLINDHSCTFIFYVRAFQPVGFRLDHIAYTIQKKVVAKESR